MTTWGPGPAGFALGFVVAAQVGPVWLLCARTSLRHGLRAGLAVGLGAALVDLMYACLGVAGAAGLLRLTGLRVGLGLLGAAVLVFLGARTLWSAFRIRAGGEAPEEVATPGAALRTSLAATASNPLTIASWAAVFTATSTAQLTTSPVATAALLLGIAVGSMAWFTVLAVTVRLLGHRIGPRGLRAVDLVAGAGLVAYGAVLAVRSVGDPA
jgi:threonine/homoserine/homoserine lactone efflux protein